MPNYNQTSNHQTIPGKKPIVVENHDIVLLSPFLAIRQSEGEFGDAGGEEDGEFREAHDAHVDPQLHRPAHVHEALHPLQPPPSPLHLPTPKARLGEGTDGVAGALLDEEVVEPVEEDGDGDDVAAEEVRAGPVLSPEGPAPRAVVPS